MLGSPPIALGVRLRMLTNGHTEHLHLVVSGYVREMTPLIYTGNKYEYIVSCIFSKIYFKQLYTVFQINLKHTKIILYTTYMLKNHSKFLTVP
jgi:hypothetical protein